MNRERKPVSVFPATKMEMGEDGGTLSWSWVSFQRAGVRSAGELTKEAESVCKGRKCSAVHGLVLLQASIPKQKLGVSGGRCCACLSLGNLSGFCLPDGRRSSCKGKGRDGKGTDIQKLGTLG